MKNVIEVNGIKLYAHHGCLEEEALIGGNYIVDLVVETNFEEAAKNDTLKNTVDYVILNKIVKEEMAIRSKLIEHVGKRILDRTKNDLPQVSSLKVKITKLCPPINGNVDNVAIIIKG